MKLILENWRKYLKENEEESYESKVVRLFMSSDPGNQGQGVYFLESGLVDKQEVLRLFIEAVGEVEREKQDQIAAAMSSIEFDNDIFLALLEAMVYLDGGLNLYNTQIKSLPAGLKISGTLWLRDTPIESLPTGLKVGGNLWLSNTPIKSLPAGLNIGGSLSLTNTQIKSLPADLQVGGRIYGFKGK